MFQFSANVRDVTEKQRVLDDETLDYAVEYSRCRAALGNNTRDEGRNHLIDSGVSTHPSSFYSLAEHYAEVMFVEEIDQGSKGIVLRTKVFIPFGSVLAKTCRQLLMLRIELA